MNSHIRIVNDTMMGRNAHIYYVDKDGNETEISDVVTELKIEMNVEDLTTASIKVIKVTAETLVDEKQLTRK